MIDNEGFKISDQGKPHFVISYDKNGNIQSLDRRGHIAPNPFQANSGDFGLIRDFKKFISKQILTRIKNEPESRRDWMLALFEKAAKSHSRNKNFQFWK